ASRSRQPGRRCTSGLRDRPGVSAVPSIARRRALDSDKRARTRRSSDATASTAARTPTMPAPKPASPSPPTHQPAPRPHSRARTGAKQTPVTPLRIISLFLALSETVVGIGAMKTSGTVQWLLVIFAMLLPTMVAVAFFWLLRDRAFAFYHPAEYG